MEHDCTNMKYFSFLWALLVGVEDGVHNNVKQERDEVSLGKH